MPDSLHLQGSYSPTILTPATLFTKVYLDIMMMPKAQGYQYIVAARDDLSGAAEGHKLKKGSARAVAQFIFEELICRYGSIAEIVMDNGSEAKGATDELLRRHGIPQIRISPYNSQANGVIKHGHFIIREALVKACNRNISKWPDLIHHAFFADRVTTRKATGFSPYYLLYGVDPVLPLDLFKATYLVSGFKKNITTEELLALQILQLAKHDSDIKQAAETLHQS
jgi:Integrase core domain